MEFPSVPDGRVLPMLCRPVGRVSSHKVLLIKKVEGVESVECRVVDLYSGKLKDWESEVVSLYHSR